LTGKKIKYGERVSLSTSADESETRPKNCKADRAQFLEATESEITSHFRGLVT
jgi:hypothetical protein